MKFLIDNFGVSNLFGRDNYEYYARISGRLLKVEENWIFAFKYPPDVPRESCNAYSFSVSKLNLFSNDGKKRQQLISHF